MQHEDHELPADGEHHGEQPDASPSIFHVLRLVHVSRLGRFIGKVELATNDRAEARTYFAKRASGRAYVFITQLIRGEHRLVRAAGMSLGGELVDERLWSPIQEAIKRQPDRRCGNAEAEEKCRQQ